MRRAIPAANRGPEASRNAWRRTRPARKSFGRVLRRFRARSRLALGPRDVQPSAEPARPPRHCIAVRPDAIPSADAWASAGIGHPRAHAGDNSGNTGNSSNAKSRPENTIQVVVGQAKVIVLREKPRRIYIPDENVAGFQIVTDQQFAIVGKKIGRTVLNLWFPDPRNPNDPKQDRTLATWSSSCPIRERAALDVLQERKRLEAQVKAFQQALKVLEREIKEAFPDSAVQLSLVGDRLWCAASRRTLSKPHRFSASSRNTRLREGGRGLTPGTSTWLSSPAWATSRPPSMPSAKSWREARIWSTSCACRASSRSCSWSRWPK